MNLDKFNKMISNNGLFFSRADNFMDPYEGSVSHVNKYLRGEFMPDVTEETMKYRAEFMKRIKQWTFISCWHMSDFESDAMWRLYATTEKSIAICSTVGQLVSVLDNETRLGPVQYKDFDNEWTPMPDAINQFFFKRKEFEFESEFRAIYQRAPEDNMGMFDMNTKNTTPGEYVHVNLNILINNVILSPYSKNQEISSISDLINEYSFDIKNSSLSPKVSPSF